MTWQPGQPISAKTERFIIRSLLPGDINEAYVRWWNDPEIQKGFQSSPKNWGKEDALAHLRQFNNKDKFMLGIFLKENSTLIGYITARLDPEKRVAKPNVCIGDKTYWAKHVATEVTRPFLAFCFNGLGVEKVEGHIMGFSLASIAIFRHFGFKKEGQIRKRVKGAENEYVDLFIFGLLKEEWLAREEKAKAEKK